MKESAMFAKYNQAGNKTIYGLLSKMSNDEREKDRGSYYGSLSGLFRHIISGTRYFLGLYRDSLSANAAALKAIDSVNSQPYPPKEALTESQWNDLGKMLDATDAAYLGMTEALSAEDMNCQIKIDWYGGNPAEVSLFFMLSQLLTHNTHHRGQISQILDSLKVDNDYSGIAVEFR